MDGVYVTNELGSLATLLFIVFVIGLIIGAIFFKKEKNTNSKKWEHWD